MLNPLFDSEDGQVMVNDFIKKASARNGQLEVTAPEAITE
jgi:hypothetical protein